MWIRIQIMWDLLDTDPGEVADLFIKSDNVKTIKQILFLQVNFVGNFYFNFQATFYPLDPGLHVDDRCGSRIRIRIDPLTLSRH